MMKDNNLNQLVNSFFEEKENLSFSNLLKLIEEQMTSTNTLTEKAGLATSAADLENINISLPTIKITEDWGKAESKDRAIIENFTKNIAPGGTLEQKIAALNSVLTEKKADAKISEILSTMVVCEVLSSIIREFTESAGGFIFEGFLAGLFGGKSVQITSPEEIEGMDASGKPITDVILNDRHYSLKLLGQTTGVKGSFANMVEHFSQLDHVVYLDARRIEGDQGLEFGEFVITLENFLDVFVTPFLKQVTIRGLQVDSASGLKDMLRKLRSEGKPVKEIKFSKTGFAGMSGKVFTYSPRLDEVQVSREALINVLKQIDEMPEEQLEEFGPFAVSHADQKFEGTKAEKLFGSMAVVNILKRNIASGNRDSIIDSLRQTNGYKEKQQFEFTRTQAEEIAGFKTVGTLMIGEQYMKQTWAAYADLLQETIGPVYRNLQLFTNNVNNYFLEAPTKEKKQGRKQYAMDAIGDAKNLEQATSTAVEKIENN